MNTQSLQMALRTYCDRGLPGRYVAVEWLAPRLGRSILAPLGRSLTIACDPRDMIQRQVAFGLYEPAESALLRSLLQPGDTFIDVGANVGYYSLLAAEIVGPGGQVHAFEPMAANVAVLRANAERNGLANITVNQIAITDGSEPAITLYERAGVDCSGWASVVKSTRRENVAVSVPAVSLDAYLAEHGITSPALLKMDVEGAETLALRGLAQTFGRGEGPRRMLVEINTWQLEQLGASAEALLAIISAGGYSVERVEPGTGPLLVWNALATRH